MKKFKIMISTSLIPLFIMIPATILIVNSKNENTKPLKNMENKEVVNFLENSNNPSVLFFSSQAKKDIDNMILLYVWDYDKNNINVSKNISKLKILEDLKTLISSQLLKENSGFKSLLIELGKESEFRESLIIEINKNLVTLLNEESVYETRHGNNVFNRHFWDTILSHAIVVGANLYGILEISLFPVLIISSQIKNGDFLGVSQTLSEWSYQGSSIAKSIFSETIIYIARWKKQTNCSTNFYIWGLKV